MHASGTSVHRISFLDLLRIVCAYLVIVCHAVSYIHLDQVPPAAGYMALLIHCLSKVAVPVFLMISGCTLLRKMDTIKKALSRVLRIGITLAVFSALYALCLPDPSINSISRFLDSIYREPITLSYWYLYVYLGLLLMMPLLQRLVHSMTKHDFFYFFAISIPVFSICPMVIEFTPISEYAFHFQLPLFGTYICYLFLGYTLIHIPEEKLSAPLLAAGTLLGAAVNALMMFSAYQASAGTDYRFMDNIALLPIMFSSCCFFLLARTVKLSARSSAAVCELGRCSFSIYLISDLCLEFITPMYYVLRSASGQFFAFFVLHLTAFALSVLLSALLRRIPLLRSIL